MGHKIKDDENYVSVLKELLQKMAPYDEVKNTLKPIDFKNWRQR